MHKELIQLGFRHNAKSGIHTYRLSDLTLKTKDYLNYKIFYGTKSSCEIYSNTGKILIKPHIKICKKLK